MWSWPISFPELPVVVRFADVACRDLMLGFAAGVVAWCFVVVIMALTDRRKK